VRKCTHLSNTVVQQGKDLALQIFTDHFTFHSPAVCMEARLLELSVLGEPVLWTQNGTTD